MNTHHRRDAPVTGEAARTPVLAAQARAYLRALQPGGGVEQRALMRGGGGPAAPGCVLAALYSSPPYDLRVPALALPRLSITLTPAPVHGALEDDRPRHWRTPRHALFLTPAGAAARWRKPAPSRHINVYFDAAALGEEEQGLAALGAAPLFNLRLPGLGVLADALASELSEPQAWAAEAADSLGRLILVRLARRHGGRGAARNPLSPAALERLDEFVKAHLSQTLRVADLARVVGLSPSHFAHAYSRITGRSPHRAVVDARVAHAVSMLRHTGTPLAEVALASGFASQQHLSRVLRQRTGLTPTRLRREAAEAGPRDAD